MKQIIRVAYLVLVALAWGAGRPVAAQQLAQLSQYMNNNYLINPAVAGTEDYVDIKVSHRAQWVGIEGAPRTYYATVHSALTGNPRRSLRHRRHSFTAVGGLLYADVTGPTSRTGAYFSFAQNLALTRHLRLALGASVGMQQFAIDGQQLQFHDVNPGPQGSVAAFAPDATVGAWLYGPNFYAGASVAQLLNSSLDASFQQTGAAAQNTLQPHYYLTGGVRLPINPDLVLVPSALIKVTATAPASVDLSLRVRYLNTLWAGASLRWADAVVAMAGVNLNKSTSLTYSYDIGISSLNPYHSGSHELLLGLRIKRKTRARDSRFW